MSRSSGRNRAAQLAAKAGAAMAQLPLAAVGAAMSLAGTAAGTLMRGLYQGFRNGFVSWGAYHDAARRDATNTDWRARLSSADQSVLWDLDTMLARSRAQVANDGYAASAQGAYRRGVVGGGISARSAAKDPASGAMLDDFNKQLDGLWNEYYWDPAACDAEQNKTMPEKQQLWMGDLFAAGGIFVIEGYRPRPDCVCLPLQEIEYEQRDAITVEYQGRAVRGGVEVGDFHEPVAYHLFTAAHPLEEPPSVSTRVPAGQCIHVYRQDRVRQRLGTPWMRSVLTRMRNLAMFEWYTMNAARGQAAYTGFITQDPSSPAGGAIPAIVARRMGLAAPPGEQAPNSDGTDGRVNVNVAPGLFPILKPHQDVKFPPPSQPNTNYNPFVVEQLKAIASGTGLDFQTLTRWYADANFASLRQGKLDLMAEIEWIQDLLFVRKAMTRIRKNFLETAIREARIAAPGYFQSAAWRQAYLATNWQGPPKYGQDDLKEAASWKMYLALGLKTPQQFFNQHGMEAREVAAELKEYFDLMKKNGLEQIIQAGWFGGGAGVAKFRQPNSPGAGSAGDPTLSQENQIDEAGGALAGGNGDGLRPLEITRRMLIDQLLSDSHGGNGHGA